MIVSYLIMAGDKGGIRRLTFADVGLQGAEAFPLAKQAVLALGAIIHIAVKKGETAPQKPNTTPTTPVVNQGK